MQLDDDELELESVELERDDDDDDDDELGRYDERWTRETKLNTNTNLRRTAVIKSCRLLNVCARARSLINDFFLSFFSVVVAAAAAAQVHTQTQSSSSSH